MLKPENYVGSLVLRRYRLDDVISSGGMGVLYGATHLRTGRRVAIKFLLDSDDNERFALEARAAAELKHPNVVDVLDMDEDDDGVPFLVLELLEGKSLAGVLQDHNRLNAEQTLAWLLPVMGALAVAHDRGILHRDLKPANIFIVNAPGGRTVPKLLDFGVAKVQSQPTLTRSGSVVGTPSYMSPEQARGDRDLQAATDVWGMGVIWFRCLTGRLPFEHEAVIGTLMRIVNERAPRVEKVADDVPRAIGWAIDRALQHDPAARYPDMRAFARALLAAALRDDITLPSSPDPSGLADWSSWLTEEKLTANTGAVARAPIGLLSSQPPPVPPVLLANVEFAPTQPSVSAVLPADTGKQRRRSRRAPLLIAALAAVGFLAGLLLFLGASGDTQPSVAPPSRSVASTPQGRAEIRLPEEPALPLDSKAASAAGVAASAATSTPASAPATAPTLSPAAKAPGKAAAAAARSEAAAKQRAARRKERAAGRTQSGAPASATKPASGAAADGFSIETDWR